MGERIDILNRKHFVDNTVRIVNQLSDNNKGCCFAIEGSWGIGKTFVLEKIEKELKREEEKFFLFHYNCWKYDYYEEPAVAIISAMISSIQEDKTLVNRDLEDTVKSGYDFLGEKMKEIAGIYLENKIGVNLISWADEIKRTKDENTEEMYKFNKLFNFSQAIEKVRENLQEIARERTIVFVVDELDRCVPQYAIKVLERLHHIFDSLENVIVIMAIDRKQLEHSVEEMFGIGNDTGRSMDVEKYLRKFIDFSMELDYGKIDTTFERKYEDYFSKFSVREDGDSYKLSVVLSQLLNTLDIRQQEKMMEKVHLVHSIVCNEKVDISVLGFEVMFEVLELWDFEDKKDLVLINDANYTNLEQKLGNYKVVLLKEIEKKSWDHRLTMNGKKIAINDVLGKMFWYFANIFNRDNIPYMNMKEPDIEVEKCLKVTKKFCEIHQYIK